MDISEISDFADYFVICSGTSDRMLQALADQVTDHMRTEHQVRGRKEGEAQDGWILVDYGDVILHLFSPDRRDYYCLEELWRRQNTPSLAVAPAVGLFLLPSTPFFLSSMAIPIGNNCKPKRIFSGIQPSGILHLGNYLGAMRQWLMMQSTVESFFCVVDYHAITTPKDPEILRSQTRSVTALYLAAGIDPEISTIFIQSHVPEHAELCWILNCVTPVGWLERMTQYKSKAAQGASVSVGLLDYPVLQAADILLYDADEVPVGEDQKQHVEITRDIAQRFNHRYGDTFIIPEASIPRTGARILALNDRTRKMSKSEAHIRGHAINLIDDPQNIRDAIQRAVTDGGQEIVFSTLPEKAGVNNLLEIYELLSGMNRIEIESHFAGKGYGALKRELVDLVVDFLRPVRQQYLDYMSDPAQLDHILNLGAERARQIASVKLIQVKQKIGFLIPGQI